ncbi:TetR/AcrR family transcriptional regulator [Actinomadura sp. SCN-SB]|uniref:TetR/AcrR family transcriptional regulator n=1 Tax=Actinomadura sp. SCN-SB TaxID=3373092 RepID=UPI0037513CF3
MLDQPGRRRSSERADAARNRRRILSAAMAIVAERGVGALSMDAVAAAAGVGVGTVYRRFTDLSGLVYALVDEQERRFQDAFLRGPAPLGPGAPPAVRIRAFLRALADRTEDQAELLLTAESATPMARVESGAYTAYHQHLAMLIGELRPGLDAHYLADALLAPLAAELFVHQRRTMSLERIKDGLDTLLAGIVS